MVQLSHPYMTTGKTIALTRWTFVSKVMPLLFNILSRNSQESSPIPQSKASVLQCSTFLIVQLSHPYITTGKYNRTQTIKKSFKCMFSIYFIIRHPFSAAAAKSLQSCPTLCDPIDGSPLGSSVPGILQARILDWVAISFSNAWKWKVKVKSLSHAQLLTTPWTSAFEAPPSIGFSRQEYWSGLPLPSPTPSLLRPIRDPRPHIWKDILFENGMVMQVTYSEVLLGIIPIKEWTKQDWAEKEVKL